MKEFQAVNSPKIREYVNEVFHPEDAVLKEIRARSEKSGLPMIQVGEMDGLHLEVLARAAGIRRAVEIGTLGGYSGVQIARGLAPGGKLFTFEFDPHHAEVARESFRLAGIEDRVEILVGPALENLPRIEAQGPFDWVFIDADKANYPSYLRWALDHLRVGGIIVADNTFAFGMIADNEFESPEDRETVLALREFNREAAQNPRLKATLLPTGEGLTIAVKVR